VCGPKDGRSGRERATCIERLPVDLTSCGLAPSVWCRESRGCKPSGATPRTATEEEARRLEKGRESTTKSAEADNRSLYRMEGRLVTVVLASRACGGGSEAIKTVVSCVLQKDVRLQEQVRSRQTMVGCQLRKGTEARRSARD